MPGQLKQDWINDCRTNESDESRLEDWIMTVLNCREVSIDDKGSVWVAGPMAAYWLSQDECDSVVAAIEAGI